MSYFQIATTGGGGGGSVNTLTGDTGGAISPDGAGNINVLGGPGIIVTGNQAGNKLTVGPIWTTVTGTSQQMALSNGYIPSNAGLVTFTLPVTAAIGTVMWIFGLPPSGSNGGYRISQNAGQSIMITPAGVVTTPGVTGYLQTGMGSEGNAIVLTCIKANLTWTGWGMQGNAWILV